MSPPPALSVVIPALDEAAGLPRLLAALPRAGADRVEVIVSDGGSRDATVRLARAAGARVLVGARGRAAQMNLGAGAAAGRLLWFLHADTEPGPEALPALLRVARSGRECWGRFPVRLSGPRPLYRIVERMMDLRARVTGIATGDQGLFVSRTLFDRIGGFPAVPLMEDVELSRRLRRERWPLRLEPWLTTSSRRWDEEGAWRTILLMWRLRFAYFRGADPVTLHRRYYGDRSSVARARPPAPP